MEMTRQEKWVVSATPVVLINLCVSLPFLIWCIFAIGKHWNDKFFSKRRPILIIAFISSLSLHSIGDITMYYIYLIGYDYDTIELIYNILYSCLFYPSLSMAESILIMRIWLLYFDNNHARLLKNEHWQLSINPNPTNKLESQRSFYLNPKNQRIWAGNGSFLFKIACIILFIETIVYSFVFAFSRQYLESVPIEIASVVIKSILGIIIWTRFVLKRFNKYDAFGIYKQLWISSILMFIFESIALTATGIGSAWYWYDEEYWIVYYYWQTIYFLFVIYIEVPSIENLRKQDRNSINNSRQLKMNLEKEFENNVIKFDEIEKVQWPEIVVTGFGYSSFITHLETEFSVENMLFITEYIKIKDTLNNHYSSIINKIKTTQKNTYFHVTFPKTDAKNTHKNKNNNNNNNNNNKSKNNDNNDNNNNDNNHNKRSSMSITATSMESPKIIPSIQFTQPPMTLVASNSEIESQMGSIDHNIQVSRMNGDSSKMEIPASNLENNNDNSENKNDDNNEEEHSRGIMDKLTKWNVINVNYNRFVFESIDVQIPQSTIINECILNEKYLNKDNILVGKGIIQAFMLLYGKYIDPENAALMINIDSAQRKKLKTLLDAQNYKIQLLNSTLNMNKNEIENEKNNDKKQNECLCLIEQNWNENENDLIWLINELFVEMDNAARQITVLMKESFVRFKLQHYQEFQKAFKLSKKYKSKSTKNHKNTQQL